MCASICALFLKGEDEDDTADIAFFETIEYRARVDSQFTIALSKIDHQESCTLEFPDGTDRKLEDIKTDGVVAFEASVFTSCRVVIGPVDTEDLLGKWILCGQYTESDVVHRRCQPATIAYSQYLFVRN